MGPKENSARGGLVHLETRQDSSNERGRGKFFWNADRRRQQKHLFSPPTLSIRLAPSPEAPQGGIKRPGILQILWRGSGGDGRILLLGFDEGGVFGFHLQPGATHDVLQFEPESLHGLVCGTDLYRDWRSHLTVEALET